MAMAPPTNECTTEFIVCALVRPWPRCRCAAAAAACCREEARRASTGGDPCRAASLTDLEYQWITNGYTTEFIVCVPVRP